MRYDLLHIKIFLSTLCYCKLHSYSMKSIKMASQGMLIACNGKGQLYVHCSRLIFITSNTSCSTSFKSSSCMWVPHLSKLDKKTNNNMHNNNVLALKISIIKHRCNEYDLLTLKMCCETLKGGVSSLEHQILWEIKYFNILFGVVQLYDIFATKLMHELLDLWSLILSL